MATKTVKEKVKKGARGDKPREKTPSDLGPVVVFVFRGAEGQHIVGIPARDLTLEDYDALEGDFKAKVGPKWEVHANADNPEQAIYHRVMKVSEARTEHAKRAKAADAKATKANKSVARETDDKAMQVDPDPRTPNRTDSDVVATGLAVPQTDEPIQENAPGFQQSDTGGPQGPG